ncbi:MAG: hypothetical protein A2201_03955, partial [Alicyclobacillus sp. RIFOXYA1_FULL_53_8]
MKSELTVHCKIQSRSLMVVDGEKRYNFDRTGRFLFLTAPGRAIRRGLDHRMVESWQDSGLSRVRNYRDLSDTEKNTIMKDAYAAVRAFLTPQASHLEQNWLTRILEWETRGLDSDTKAFRQTYLPISILPPDQYHSLVVQVTEGCSYNRCLFCDFYRDRPFHIKSAEELTAHLQNIQTFFGERLHDLHEVFLGDGNALVVPTERLLSMLEQIRSELRGQVGPLSTFVDTFTLDKKSVADLVTLRTAGLNTAYIGFETGLNELRSLLKKPGTSQEAVAAILQLKQADWRVAIILLVNIGNDDLSKRHMKATVDALAELPLESTDLIYLSPFVEPSNAPYLASSHSLREQLVSSQLTDVNREL